MPRITALRPSPSDPSLIEVFVDAERLGAVLRETLTALGLVDGQTLSPRLRRAIAAAIAAADARGRALRMLAVRDASRSAIALRLARRNLPPDAIERALDDLAADGWLDDARYASERARVLADRGRSSAAIRATLLRAGVERELIEAAVRGVRPPQSDQRAADRAAKKALAGRRDRRSLRRAAASLARSGFDADTIGSAFAALGIELAGRDDEE